ncbi:MAG: SixA phosphatase family protein [Leptospirillia bacterium]
MRVCLVRHGAAADGEFPELLRPLTLEGRRSVKRLARAISRSVLRVDAIVSSPLTRAVQTAEILLAKLPKHHPVRHVSCLVELAGDFIPGQFSERTFLGWLAECELSNVIFVGHEPTLLALAFWIDPSLENSNKISGIPKSSALLFSWSPGRDGRYEGHIFPEN